MQISFLSPGCLFPHLKEKEKKNRKKEKEEKGKKREGEKKKEKEKGKGKKKKKKKPCTAQLLLCPSQSDMVFGACPVLSFTSPPSSQWVGLGEPLQGAAYAVQKAAVFPPRKKKKRLLQPLLPAKLRFPLLAISNSKAVFVAKLLPPPLNPGNSNVGSG